MRGRTLVAWLFPGQGSQHKGMGGELFTEFPALVQEASDILGYSLTELCLADPERRLAQTEFAQPALYCVNALALRKRLQDAAEPQFYAGHSLGEYNALEAAGALEFAAGLRLVARRGKLMAAARDGGMAA
ncbi:MAG: PfaD family protein, partial [Myxococcaceae bacterium]|nr:PfaD family protein [Myxococcaceae bacterium]